MPIPGKIAFRRQHTGDRNVDEAQRLAQQLQTRTNACPLINGNLVKQVTIVTAAAGTTINHGLGRVWTGWIITRVFGNGALFVEATNQPDPTRQIAILSSVQTVVDIWFF